MHKNQLIASQTFFSIIEQSASAIVITDTSGIIQYVNPRFLKLTGYTNEEVVGNSPRILRSGNTPSEVYQEMWAMISTGKAWRGEIQNKRKNGELYWESITISPILDEIGEIKHYLGVEEDISEKKLLGLQLLETLESLRKSNQDLEQFNRIVSHDLRGPLSTVEMALELIEDSAGKSLDENGKMILTA